MDTGKVGKARLVMYGELIAHEEKRHAWAGKRFCLSSGSIIRV